MLFDRSLLPENLCELQYLKMVQCENRMSIDNNENLCSYPTKLFLECKTKRVTHMLCRTQSFLIGSRSGKPNIIVGWIPQ